MENILRQFYNNQSEREALKAFMVEVLKEIAVEKTFNGESVEGIKEAHELIGKMFDTLEVKYGIIKKVVIQDSK